MAIDLPVLRTDRISLEPFRAGDEDALLAGARDPLVAQFAGVPWSDMGRADMTVLIEERWPALRAAGSGAISSIRDAQTDAVLGYLPFFDVNVTHRRAELGYWLLPVGRGRGIATEAVALIVEWALGDFGLLRMQASTDVGNVASQRVLERAGFEPEGVLRSYATRGDGTQADYVLYSRLAPSAQA